MRNKQKSLYIVSYVDVRVDQSVYTCDTTCMSAKFVNSTQENP